MWACVWRLACQASLFFPDAVSCIFLFLLKRSGAIATEFGKRKAAMRNMHPHADGYRYTFQMPTRAFLGLRSVLMSKTRGTVVMNSLFLRFAPLGEDLPRTRNGVLVAHGAGNPVSCGFVN